VDAVLDEVASLAGAVEEEDVVATANGRRGRAKYISWMVES